MLSAYFKGEDAKKSDLRHESEGRMRGRVTQKLNVDHNLSLSKRARVSWFSKNK